MGGTWRTAGMQSTPGRPSVAGWRTEGWEGLRPRDPPFSKPKAFPNQGRKSTVCFENAFAARGDARPLCQGFLGFLRLTRTAAAGPALGSGDCPVTPIAFPIGQDARRDRFCLTQRAVAT